MKIQNISIGLYFFLFFLCNAHVIRQTTPVRFGSEWGPGLFSESVEIQRLLPLLLYYRVHMQVMQFIRYMVTEIDNNPKVRKLFETLKEGPLKQEIRRQYFLCTKGRKLDDKPISFRISELVKANVF